MIMTINNADFAFAQKENTSCKDHSWNPCK